MRTKKDGEEGQTAKRMSTPAYISILVTASVVVIVGAVFVGKSDSGAINVNTAIQNSNQADGDDSNDVEAVPPQFQNMVNGGLVPQENVPVTPEPTPLPVTESTTTASTTEPEEGATTEVESEVVPEGETTPAS
jgi:hypothetical protein